MTTRAVSLSAMWPPEALEFLRELEANNDRDWFRANRGRYDTQLGEPAASSPQSWLTSASLTVQALQRHALPHAPADQGAARAAVGYGGAGGYYVELSLDGLWVAAGLHARHRTSSSATARRSTTEGRGRVRAGDRLGAVRPGSRPRGPG